MSFIGNNPGRGGQVLPGQVAPLAINYGNLDSTVTGPMSGYKNKLINGNFDFWQRGTALSGLGFLADRWGVDSGGSAAFIQSRQPFTFGGSSLSIPAKYYYNLNMTNGGDPTTGVVLLRQRIEGVDAVRGQITVSFWAAADVGKSISVNFAQYFGTGGSPSATVYGTAQKITPGVNFVKQALTFTLPSVLGKTLGTNGDDFLEIEFIFSAGANYSTNSGNLGIQTGNFNLAQIQCENGTVGTPFEYRPIGIEWLLCQRYYEIGSIAPMYIAGVNTVAMMFPFTYKATKRTTPSIVFSGITYYSAGNATPTSTGLSAVGVGIDACSLYISSGTTNMNGLAGGTWVASAEL